jgi:hypothetical protein
MCVVKFDTTKTSSRRKMRKAHFGATSVERRVRMSSSLSKDLFQKYHVSYFHSHASFISKLLVLGSIYACYQR